MERKPEVLSPLEMRPSSIAPNPEESRDGPPTPQHPSPLRGTMGSSLRSPGEVEGNDGFPLQAENVCLSLAFLESFIPQISFYFTIFLTSSEIP